MIFSVQNRGSQTQDTGQLARKPHTIIKSIFSQIKKQPTRAELKKRCSENMQQIYRRTPMPKCDFNNVVSNFIEISLRHGCSPVNLLHIFSSPFLMNTSGRLLLQDASGTYMRHLEDTLDVFRRFNAF